MLTFSPGPVNRSTPIPVESEVKRWTQPLRSVDQTGPNSPADHLDHQLASSVRPICHINIWWPYHRFHAIFYLRPRDAAYAFPCVRTRKKESYDVCACCAWGGKLWTGIHSRDMKWNYYIKFEISLVQSLLGKNRSENIGFTFIYTARGQSFCLRLRWITQCTKPAGECTFNAWNWMVMVSLLFLTVCHDLLTDRQSCFQILSFILEKVHS